ncbi:insulinase family protein, partial [Klebsiella pneumoniae]|uniref:insulinase family protein n=1 Tax=Klebsiella pneumoniae TaxID=573 RepID=UPI0038535DA4
PPNGTIESLPAIQSADLKDYAQRVIAKDSLKIAVVGDLTPEALGKLLDDTFGSLPARGNLTPVPEVAAVKPPQHTSAIVDVPQTSVNFGGPGIA